MNLLGKISKYSKRSKNNKQYPWHSHRYTGRLLILAICIFIFEYHSHTKARSFEGILESKILRVAYIKSPDVLFESEHRPAGFQYDVISEFANAHSLELSLIQTDLNKAHIGLNNNLFDLVIGNFEQQIGQHFNPFSRIINESIFKIFLSKKETKENWKPYQETLPWHYTNVAIIEHKEKATPKTQELSPDDSVYYRQGFPTHLKVMDEINLEPFEESNLLENIANQTIQFAATTISQVRINQKYHAKIRTIENFDDAIAMVWLLAENPNDKFTNAINTFLTQEDTVAFVDKRQEYWHQQYNYLDYLDIVNINNKTKTSLPYLKVIFESAAESENLDWTLLAAVAFQESNWELNAISPTQVRGVMQLTESTAKTLGVINRTDPYESIHGAAKYLKQLEQIIPIKANRNDRIWMAVAAYNLGIGRVRQAINSVQDKGIEINWLSISNELTERSETFTNNKYSTGKRAVEYVERVREFQQLLNYYAAE